MKKILLGLGLLTFTSMLYSQNGLENIIVEKYYISSAADNIGDYPLAEGSTTYRIYVDLLENYNFQAVYGDPNHKLELKTTTYFFNNEDRGNSSPTYTKSQAANNTVMLDSWVSCGGAASGQIGVLKSDDDGAATIVNADGILQNDATLAGIPLTQEDGMITGTVRSVNFTPGLDVSMLEDINNNGDTFQVGGSGSPTDGGSWYATPGVTGLTALNRVLIAQITTDGDFSFELNIQIGTPTGDVQKYVANNPTGNEIQIASLIQSFNATGSNPTISITSPTTNSTFIENNSVTITANALDTDGTIASVEFFIDGTSIGIDNSAPYSANYVTITGNHEITAIATDNDGLTTTSSIIEITVDDDTKILQISKQDKILIYPTIITNSNVTIDNLNSNLLQYKIFDAIGNCKLEGQNSSSKIILDLSKFAEGIYFISVNSETQKTCKKIIIK